MKITSAGASARFLVLQRKLAAQRKNKRTKVECGYDTRFPFFCFPFSFVLVRDIVPLQFFKLFYKIIIERRPRERVHSEGCKCTAEAKSSASFAPFRNPPFPKLSLRPLSVTWGCRRSTPWWAARGRPRRRRRRRQARAVSRRIPAATCRCSRCLRSGVSYVGSNSTI